MNLKLSPSGNEAVCELQICYGIQTRRSLADVHFFSSAASHQGDLIHGLQDVNEVKL